jgi:hypothetical protein
LACHDGLLLIFESVGSKKLENPYSLSIAKFEDKNIFILKISKISNRGIMREFTEETTKFLFMHSPGRQVLDGQQSRGIVLFSASAVSMVGI